MESKQIAVCQCPGNNEDCINPTCPRWYVRTRGGRMVHREGCPKLKRAKHFSHWQWAAHRSLQWIDACLEWNGVGGVAFCKTCCPELHNDGDGGG